MQALRRFGTPEPFIEMVTAIYSDRVFDVRDCGATSGVHKQRAGICQGCPLYPFLLVIVMTILMESASSKLGPEARVAVQGHRFFEVLYADDTLLLGTEAVSNDRIRFPVAA